MSPSRLGPRPNSLALAGMRPHRQRGTGTVGLSCLAAAVGIALACTGLRQLCFATGGTAWAGASRFGSSRPFHLPRSLTRPEESRVAARATSDSEPEVVVVREAGEVASEEQIISSEGLDDIHKILRIRAVGKGRGSFLLEMGGQKLLINPNLIEKEDSEFVPGYIHRQVDYVVITSANDELLHRPTFSRMNLAKTNVVASFKAGEELNEMYIRNLAVLASGPDGQVVIEGENGTAPIAISVVPGSQQGPPWEEPEVGFVFVNTKTGVAVAYEAFGMFLGQGASSNREGIPELAYQVDYLVTPDLREGAFVAKGLTEKGAKLRGVVRLPPLFEDPEVTPILAPLVALDRAIDLAMGGIDDKPEGFRDYLEKEGGDLANIELFDLVATGGKVELNGAA